MEAPKFAFTNPDVAAKYDAPLGRDKKITLPGVYSGMLSNITLPVAEKLEAMGDNQVAPKGAKAIVAAKPEKPAAPAKPEEAKA